MSGIPPKRRKTESENIKELKIELRKEIINFVTRPRYCPSNLLFKLFNHVSFVERRTPLRKGTGDGDDYYKTKFFNIQQARMKKVKKVEMDFKNEPVEHYIPLKEPSSQNEGSYTNNYREDLKAVISIYVGRMDFRGIKKFRNKYRDLSYNRRGLDEEEKEDEREKARQLKRLRKGLINWTYDCLFGRTPDKVKRAIEKRNVEEMGNEKKLMFELQGGKLLLERHILTKILSYLRRDVLLLDSMALVNLEFYIFVLQEWGEIKVKKDYIEKFPFLVTNFAKKINLYCTKGMRYRKIFGTLRVDSLTVLRLYGYVRGFIDENELKFVNVRELLIENMVKSMVSCFKIETFPKMRKLCLRLDGFKGVEMMDFTGEIFQNVRTLVVKEVVSFKPVYINQSVGELKNLDSLVLWNCPSSSLMYFGKIKKLRNVYLNYSRRGVWEDYILPKRILSVREELGMLQGLENLEILHFRTEKIYIEEIRSIELLRKLQYVRVDLVIDGNKSEEEKRLVLEDMVNSMLEFDPPQNMRKFVIDITKDVRGMLRLDRNEIPELFRLNWK